MNTWKYAGVGFLCGWIVFALSGRAAPPDATRVKGMQNAFFAFDNGVGRGQWSPPRQAETLRELGYAGIGYTGTDQLAERRQAFASQKLKIFSLYVPCYPGKEAPFPAGLMEALKELQGTETMLWLTVEAAGKKIHDEDAARVVRQLADAAKEQGVKIALYPHYGFHVATARDALRLLKMVDRPNVGVTLNLCHELRAGNEAELGAILQEAAPHLYLVSINGADHAGDWDKLIQPLDRGEFDIRAFLKKLKAAGYTGPIGLQCFNVRGDLRENLARSMAAWKKLLSE